MMSKYTKLSITMLNPANTGSVVLVFLFLACFAYPQTVADPTKQDEKEFDRFKLVRTEIVLREQGNFSDRRTYEGSEGLNIVMNAEIITKGIKIEERFDDSMSDWQSCTSIKEVKNPEGLVVGKRVVCNNPKSEWEVGIIFTYDGAIVKTILAHNLETALAFENQTCPRSHQEEGRICKF